MPLPAHAKRFITTALPYANGPFHMGHIMEYIQADIWARFSRMQGYEVHFVCADDTHGAPIMIAAEKADISPKQFVAHIGAGRRQYLEGFYLSFDYWSSTDSDTNHQFSKDIYRALHTAGFITCKTIEQFFDPVKQMFLPDRYVKGECPQCGASDQYGDACENCSTVYCPTELRHPRSTLTGTIPVLKSSEHFFFTLSDPRCVTFLREWALDPNRLQLEVINKAREWLADNQKLDDWDISRDAPYFGIEIPSASGKYFYVWLDAPIGYLSALKEYFITTSRDFDAFMKDDQAKQYHFIGKDVMYFHTLFWPAMLYFSGKKVPDNVFVHGFLTINGEKMSKSRGIGLSPLRYLELGMDPEWLRYYLATKLSNKIEDIDFNANDFLARVNADLIGKYINIASRAAGFITKKFDGALCTLATSVDAIGQYTLLTQIRQASCTIEAFYESREYSKALRLVMEQADHVNAWVDTHKPWLLAKEDEKTVLLHQVCTSLIEAFRLLTLYLKPVLPKVAQRVEGFLSIPPLQWADVTTPLANGHRIQPYEHLMTRVTPVILGALFYNL